MVELCANTTVGVCDTQPVTAAGVRAVLGSCPDFEFLWAVNSLDEGVRMARLQPPRVVLADKGLGVNGLIHWILNLRSAPVTPVIVIWGASLTEGEALRFVQAGAKGVIRKAAPPEALLACLRTAGRALPGWRTSSSGAALRSCGAVGRISPRGKLRCSAWSSRASRTARSPANWAYGPEPSRST